MSSPGSRPRIPATDNRVARRLTSGGRRPTIPVPQRGAKDRMIMRVLSVRIAPDRGAEFHAFVRERGLPRIQRNPGLVSVQVGRRADGPSEHAILVTVWRDWESLIDAVGPDPSQAFMLTSELGLVDVAMVEHYEAVDLPADIQAQFGGDIGEIPIVVPARN